MSRLRLRLIVAFAAVAAAGVAAALLARGGDPPGSSPQRAAPAPTAPRAPDRPDRTRPRRKRPRPTEEQAIARVRRMTPYVWSGSRRGRLVALTFDDGPGPITPALIDELRRLDVPATFFQVAGQIRSNPDMARTAARRPFAVGSHTLSHPYLSKLGLDEQWREIAAGGAAIEANSGRRPPLFRPPYGHWNDDTVRAARRERALMVFWSVSSRDWIHRDPQVIAERVVRQVRPGGIVLMHDFGGATREPTLRAVPLIVRTLRRRGYRFVTVPRLLRDAPPSRRPPPPPRPFPL